MENNNNLPRQGALDMDEEEKQPMQPPISQSSTGGKKPRPVYKIKPNSKSNSQKTLSALLEIPIDLTKAANKEHIAF